MLTEDMEEKLVSELAAGLADKTPDEVVQVLEQYGLNTAEIDDVMEVIDRLHDAEGLVDAQQMADEDGTTVSIKEVDEDSDGDIDKVTIAKDSNEDDDDGAVFTEEEIASIQKDLEEEDDDDDDDDPHDQKLSPTEYSKKVAEARGAKKGEPAPDMFNKTNQFAKLLGERRF